MIVAIAGRLTPLIRPMRSSADAIVAPVLPAEIIADAWPSRTASAARTRVESFLRRTARPASSSISMTSLASSSGRSPMSARSFRSGRPDQQDRCAFSRGRTGAGDDRAGRVVAAHGVDRDRQHQVRLRDVISRLRRRRGSCTSRTSGTPCAASWRCRSEGKCCEQECPASTRRRGGCGSSSSTSSSWERPQRVSRLRCTTRLRQVIGGTVLGLRPAVRRRRRV